MKGFFSVSLSPADFARFLRAETLPEGSACRIRIFPSRIFRFSFWKGSNLSASLKAPRAEGVFPHPESRGVPRVPSWGHPRVRLSPKNDGNVRGCGVRTLPAEPERLRLSQTQPGWEIRAGTAGKGIFCPSGREFGAELEQSPDSSSPRKGKQKCFQILQ